MRRCALLIPAILLLASLSKAESRTIHGFVTAIQSPNRFEIDEYKITRFPGQVLEIEKLKYAPAGAPTFRPEDIRVGTELEIAGDYDASTHELRARSVKVFLFDTVIVSRTAQLQKIPELEKSASGAWNGPILADGQGIVVAESTPITVSPTLVEPSPAKAKALARGQGNTKKSLTTPQQVPFTSLDQLDADTFVHYEGALQPDGSILASKVVFEKAGLDPSEAKIWDKMKPKLNEKNSTPSKPGHLKVAGHGYTLFPNKDVRDYVSGLGSSLVPDQQQALQAGDPLKINFRFYVVADTSVDCIGYPNGVVVVRSGLLSAVENEAQLAYVLSQEISAAVEKAAWRDLEYHLETIHALRNAGTIGMFAPFFSGIVVSVATYEAEEKALNDDYGQSLYNQADRVALQTMLARGYDIREAPRAWQAMVPHFGEYQTDWKKSDADRRRSYLEAQLNGGYVQVDFSGLKRDSPDFRRIAQMLAAPGKSSAGK